jgi:two-component system, chemotaxis family, sensor kinase CheA
MSDVLDRKEFIAGYLVEVDEHLRSANTQLLAIDESLHKNEPHQRRVRELFRALHTLKGLSAMVGVEPVVDLAHEMEAILRVADQSTGRLSLPAVEVLLKGVRAIEARVGAFGSGKPVAPAPLDLLDALTSLQPSNQPPPEARTASIGLEPELLAKLSAPERAQLVDGASGGRHAVRIQYVPSPARTADGVSITTVRERVTQLAEIVKVLPVALPRVDGVPAGIAFVLLVTSEHPLEELSDAALGSPAELIEIRAAEVVPSATVEAPDEEGVADAGVRTNSIRVDVARLDDAMEKLSELVVTRFKLSRAVNELRDRGVDVRDLMSIMSESSRQLRDLRGCITRARMVPVRELLERVPLIVRGMSRSTGKSVRLLVEAGSAELDKAVAERVFPAIVHLVRNAIDHAIEPPEERRGQGKPEQGLVTVTCFQHSNTELELRVADDGRGLDPVAIAARAGRDVPRNDKELLELITLPGFSTLDQATSSSGRGMGMDIVQRIAVNTLGGSLSLRTARQQGSVFTLRIPLSISIVDAFTFACGEQAFVVPVSMVDEIIEIDPARVVTPPAPQAVANLRMIERRGRSLPLVALASLFSLAGRGADAQKALVVRHAEEPFAFAVDRVLGQQEVVVRPIDDPLVKVTGVSGSTDLGDGKPTLVVDLLGLVKLASASTRRVEA